MQPQHATLGSPRSSPVWLESRSENGPLAWKNNLAAFVRGTVYLSNPSSTHRKFKTLRNKVSQAFQGHQDHRKPTSGVTSTMRGKTDENKKKHAVNVTHFSSRTTNFARRVFPTRYELICKFGTLRKSATLATKCNSQFAGNISRLAGIFAEKTQKNSLDAPTSGSHNFSVQASICANLISLEIRLLKLSNCTTHDPFWALKDLQKLPRKTR